MAKNGAFAGLKQRTYRELGEACDELALDFNVDLRPERTADDEGAFTIVCHDRQAVTREFEGRRVYLASVGLGYHGVNYREAFGIAEPMINELGFVVVGGGAPGIGRRGYLEIETGEEIVLAKGDTIRNRITLTSSHDGTGKIEVRMTPYRAKNGTALTFDAARPLAFKHTMKVHQRIAASRKSLRRIRSAWEEFTTGAQKMQTVKLTDQEARQFVERMLPAPKGKEVSKRLENMRDDVYATFKTSRTITQVPMCRGTLFGLVQAFAEWADNRTPKKSKKRDDVEAGLDARLISDGAKKKAKVWGMALWMANHGPETAKK